jgi:hypothetical protein
MSESPEMPAGWMDNIKRLRVERMMKRRHNLFFGVEWYRLDDPIGLWPVHVRILKSSTPVMDENNRHVYDKKTRQKLVKNEYVYVTVIADLGDTIRRLKNKISERTNLIGRKSFDLLMEKKVMPEQERNEDGQLIDCTIDPYPIEDETVLYCQFTESR